MNINEKLIKAAEIGDLKKMQECKDAGATEFGQAHSWAALNGRLEAMNLLDQWSAERRAR